MNITTKWRRVETCQNIHKIKNFIKFSLKKPQEYSKV